MDSAADVPSPYAVDDNDQCIRTCRCLTRVDMDTFITSSLSNLTPSLSHEPQRYLLIPLRNAAVYDKVKVLDGARLRTQKFARRIFWLIIELDMAEKADECVS